MNSRAVLFPLFGVALGLLIGVDPLIGVLATSIAAALLLARPWRISPRGGLIPGDTLTGLIGHAGLALGFVLLASLETVRADLLGYLFGDVLALGLQDILWIIAFGAAALLVLAAIWRNLLFDTMNPDILAAEHGGQKGAAAQTIFLVLVAVLIALGLRVVGALLIVALVIIPPAAARAFVRSPEAMAGLSAAIGAVSAPIGLLAAFAFDLPAGPAIVLAAAAMFLVSTAAASLLYRPR